MINVKTETPQRINRLFADPELKNVSAVLLLTQPNIYYFTGFTGHDSWTLLTPHKAFLFTDSRYTIQAKAESPRARILVRSGPMVPFFTENLAKTAIRRIGFLAEEMSVGLLDRLSGARKSVRWVKLSAQPVQKLRQIKSAGEISQIGKALAAAQGAYLELLKTLKAGRTEREVAAELEFRMRKLGAQKASFDIIVAGGPNGAMPHARTTASRIAPGRPIVIDFGARVGEYCSDLTRTVCVGTMPRYFADMYRVCLAAQLAGIDAVRPGARTNDVDAAARKIITRAGYGRYFQHGLGHGLGLDVHESPSLSRTVSQILEPGMVVTVEPGIYLPGKAGVRIEDDVLVTNTGHKVLSNLPKDLDAVTI